jgi:hypothetical protein
MFSGYCRRSPDFFRRLERFSITIVLKLQAAWVTMRRRVTRRLIGIQAVCKCHHSFFRSTHKGQYLPRSLDFSWSGYGHSVNEKSAKKYSLICESNSSFMFTHVQPEGEIAIYITSCFRAFSLSRLRGRRRESARMRKCDIKTSYFRALAFAVRRARSRERETLTRKHDGKTIAFSRYEYCENAFSPWRSMKA